MSFQGSFLPPGQLPSIESIEQDLTSVIWNRLELQVIGSHSLIDGAARDTGNTGFTDVLRPGLLLTKTAGGKFIQWGAVTSFAADKIQGVLLMSQKMTRMGSNQDRWLGYVLLGGYVKVNGLIVPTSTSAGIAGHAQETNIRTQMKYAFHFDDDPLGHLAS
jgi:hypothetical protein